MLRVEIIDDPHGRAYWLNREWCELLERISAEMNLSPSMLLETALGFLWQTIEIGHKR